MIRPQIHFRPQGILPGLLLLSLIFAGGTGGCAHELYNPARAMPSYPESLHTINTADMQVFRDDQSIEIVNATPVTYRDCTVWINQQFALRLEEIPAGETVRLSLWDFFDERGEVFNAGGFFATFEPTPVRLVEIQPGPETPLVGLITIREEE